MTTIETADFGVLLELLAVGDDPLNSARNVFLSDASIFADLHEHKLRLMSKTFIDVVA